MSFVTGVMLCRFQDRLLEAKQTADSTPPTPVVRQQKPVVSLPAHNLVVPKNTAQKEGPPPLPQWQQRRWLPNQ